jgi:hypothetical protein
MSDSRLTQLELQLEHAIESAFAHLFSRTLNLHELAIEISRVMQENVQQRDHRWIAPDHYTLYLNPLWMDGLKQSVTAVEAVLCEQIVLLAAEMGYHLLMQPHVTVQPEETLDTGMFHVVASFGAGRKNTTSLLKPIALPTYPDMHNARLILDGHGTFWLRETLTTIGRSTDNHIVISDPTASRHHAQIRLRFGAYTLFDTGSQLGTWVNGASIREHCLQLGDVIQIANARLLFLHDAADQGNTAPLDASR